MPQTVTTPPAAPTGAYTPPPQISPAFARQPINPHTPKVQAALEQNQQPQPQPQPLIPPAAPASNPIAPPPPAVEPVAPQQFVQPQLIPPQVAQPQVQPVVPPAVPQQPYIDPRVLAAMQQNEIEKQRLLEENAQAQQTIQNLLSAQTELDTLKQRQALQEALGKEAFDGLETVDPADAKRITDAVLNATTPALTAMQQELARTRQMLADNEQQVNQRMQQQQIQQINNRILAAHPDFFQLQHTPEYVAFMNQRDGLSSQTLDQRAAQEFKAGNADYVIDILNRLKGAVPSPAQISTVAPVQTASALTPAPAEPAAPSYGLKELNDLMQMRQISHDEYRARLKELRAAQQA